MWRFRDVVAVTTPAASIFDFLDPKLKTLRVQKVSLAVSLNLCFFVRELITHRMHGVEILNVNDIIHPVCLRKREKENMPILFGE